MKKIIILLISTIVAVGFFGCDFFLGPDEPVGRSGNLSISVGTGDRQAGSRVISSGKDLPEEVRASLRYDITLTGPGGETIERTLANGENLQLTVALGEWRIGAAARQESSETVVGTGSLVLTVIPGINAVRVPMTLENYYYSITLPDQPNGIVEANVSAAFPETLVTLTVRPGEGYILKALTYSYGDTDIPIEESEAGYTFTMPAADITVHAEFEGIYSISGTISTDVPGGGVSGASVQLKQDGGNVGDAVSTGTDGTYTIPNVPAGEGYAIEVSLAGYTTGGSSPFGVVAANVTGQNLMLVRTVYTITAASLINGAVSANPASASEGTAITLTVTPGTGYVLKSGTLKYRYSDGDGDHVVDISGPEYTFTMPEANVTVHAEFNKVLGFTIEGPQDLMVPVTIVNSADDTSSTNISWSNDESLTFTVADDAYKAEAGNLKWLVNGEDVTATGSSLIISARDYILRTYTLTAMIKADDGLWYSKETSFTVQE
jgi:hypothetical protein